MLGGLENGAGKGGTGRSLPGSVRLSFRVSKAVGPERRLAIQLDRKGRGGEMSKGKATCLEGR